MQVVYNSGRSDQWRCNLYALFGRPLNVVLMGLLAASLWYSSSYKALAAQGPLGLAASIAIAVTEVVVINAVILWIQIVMRLPTRQSQRICTTSLQCDGFGEITPDGVQFVCWEQVSSIRNYGGDIHFWLRNGKGCFVPRSAFAEAREAHTFYETALRYWQSARAGILSQPDASLEEGVWPPPPRLPDNE